MWISLKKPVRIWTLQMTSSFLHWWQECWYSRKKLHFQDSRTIGQKRKLCTSETYAWTSRRFRWLQTTSTWSTTFYASGDFLEKNIWNSRRWSRNVENDGDDDDYEMQVRTQSSTSSASAVGEELATYGCLSTINTKGLWQHSQRYCYLFDLMYILIAFFISIW